MKKKKWLAVFLPVLVLVGLLGWGLLSSDVALSGVLFPERGGRVPAFAEAGELVPDAGGQGTAAVADSALLGQPVPVQELPATLPPSPPPSPSPTPEPAFQEYDLTLMALGDNLMHMGIVYTGRKEDGSFDYSFLFREIAPYLEAADVKMINQETIFGGNELGFSGFPRFNSPTQVGDAIADAGFNVVLHATNHAGDQGIKGLYRSVEFWKQYPDVLMAGIAGEEGFQGIPLLELGEVTFAILNYTYGPNMSTIPKDLRGHLNILCAYNEATGAIDFTKLNPQVIEDIQKARELADVVVVAPHWGNEYQSSPSGYQRTFAAQMAEAGADLIIGTHPHVPQPVEWVEAENGRRALCYYSLGNYVSTQKQGLCMLEGMAWVTFRVTEEGVVLSEEKTGILPLVCHYKSGPVRLGGVYPLEAYTEEMAAAHGIHNYGGVNLRLSDLQKWSQEIFGDWVISGGEITAPPAAGSVDDVLDP